MDKPVLMEEINSGYSLDEKIKGFIFSECALFIANDEKKVTLWDILEDQVNKLCVFQGGITSHDVDVLQLLLDLNLPSKRLLDP